MPAHRSASRRSTPSNTSNSASMSPVQSSEPLTPPEQSVLAQQFPSSASSDGHKVRPPLPHSYSDTQTHTNHGYSPAMLMPPPPMYPGQMYMSGSGPSSSSFSPLVSPSQEQPCEYGSHFNGYPQSYPYPQYTAGVPLTLTMSQTSSTSYSGRQTDTEPEDGFASMLSNMDGDDDYGFRQSSAEPSSSTNLLSSPLKPALKEQPPRPPNAWILYRSDRLKDISAGRKIKGLDQIMKDSGLSSSASSGEEMETPATSTDGKPTPKRRGKKGAKEPTEGLLRMGKGKTGRGLPQAHISKMISELWKNESPAVRAEYEKRSEQKKLEHAKEYPDYKFKPMRKADKDRAKEERDREKQAIKREKEAKATASRLRKGSRSRPSTATSPYDTTSRGMSRSSSMHAVQHTSSMLQQVGNSISPPTGYSAFPMPGHSLPSLHQDGSGSMGPPQTIPSRQSSRQPSPVKSAHGLPEMPPPPPPHTQLQPHSSQQAPYDSNQNQNQQYYPYPPPGPYGVSPEGPFYFDMHGTGPAYALPVVYEPQPLPAGQALEDSAIDFSGSVEDLVEQWVTLEEDTGEGVGEWTMDAPDVAVSQWDNLTSDNQEQYFSDLDLSHTMAAHLTPNLYSGAGTGSGSMDQTPTIDYSTGYMTYPYYSLPQQSEGPLLYTPQESSSDLTTPRQATFARNSSNTFLHPGYDSDPQERRVSTSSTTQPTRYVSSSAFPETPLSVDPSGLGGDRRISYSIAGLDNYEWAEPSLGSSDDQPQSQSQSESEEKGTNGLVDPTVSIMKLQFSSPVKSAPVDMPLSPISPVANIPNPVSEPNSPQKSGPPRGQRRARTVAGSFH